MRSQMMKFVLIVLIMMAGSSAARSQCTTNGCGQALGPCGHIEFDTSSLLNQSYGVTMIGTYVDPNSGTSNDLSSFRGSPGVAFDPLPTNLQLSSIRLILGDGCQGIFNPGCDDTVRGCNGNCFRVTSKECVYGSGCKIVVTVEDVSPCPPGVLTIDGRDPRMAYRGER